MTYIKSISLSIVFLVFTIALLPLLSCSSSSDEPTPITDEEKQIDRLAKTWSLDKVEYGADDVTDRFSGFTLTITKSKTYSSTPDRGGYDFEPFKDAGSWDFKGDNLNVLNRNDGVLMDIVVNETSLKLNFMITESNGRLAGLGEYQFEMTAQ